MTRGEQHDLDALYKTEAEIAAAVGLGVDKWRDIAHVLEKSGLPTRDPLFCDRRYWPAVRAFLDRWNNLDAGSIPLQSAAKENWQHERKPRRARTQATAA